MVLVSGGSLISDEDVLVLVLVITVVELVVLVEKTRVVVVEEPSVVVVEEPSVVVVKELSPVVVEAPPVTTGSGGIVPKTLSASAGSTHDSSTPLA